MLRFSHVLIISLTYLHTKTLELNSSLVKIDDGYQANMTCTTADAPLGNSAEFLVNGVTQHTLHFNNGACYNGRNQCTHYCMCNKLVYKIIFLINATKATTNLTCHMRFHHHGNGHKKIFKTSIFEGTDLYDTRENEIKPNATTKSTDITKMAKTGESNNPWIYIVTIIPIILVVLILTCVFLVLTGKLTCQFVPLDCTGSCEVCMNTCQQIVEPEQNPRALVSTAVNTSQRICDSNKDYGESEPNNKHHSSTPINTSQTICDSSMDYGESESNNMDPGVTEINESQTIFDVNKISGSKNGLTISSNTVSPSVDRDSSCYDKLQISICKEGTQENQENDKYEQNQETDNNDAQTRVKVQFEPAGGSKEEGTQENQENNKYEQNQENDNIDTPSRVGLHSLSADGSNTDMLRESSKKRKSLNDRQEYFMSKRHSPNKNRSSSSTSSDNAPTVKIPTTFTMASTVTTSTSLPSKGGSALFSKTTRPAVSEEVLPKAISSNTANTSEIAYPETDTPLLNTEEEGMDIDFEYVADTESVESDCLLSEENKTRKKSPELL